MLSDLRYKIDLDLPMNEVGEKGQKKEVGPDSFILSDSDEYSSRPDLFEVFETVFILVLKIWFLKET